MKKVRVIIYFAIVIFAALFNFYFRPIKGNSLVTDDYRKSDAYVNDLYKSDEYFKKHIVDKEYEDLYRGIIKTTLSNAAVTKVPCGGTQEKCYENFTKTIYSLYLDHPELISYVGVNGAKYDPKGYVTIENYEGLSSLQTKMGTRRIEREMENIRNDTKNMSDKEKILYVYDYVASHNYDRVFTSIGSNQSAYSFFTRGKSVCAGFAKASQIIFQNIGINSYLVINDTHLWNFVEYKNKWYVFDATVGASYVDKKSPYYYEGLGRTTVDKTYGFYEELYPKVETKKLKELFNV